MDKIKQLENRIAELEREMKNLNKSNSIPFPIIKSLEGLGFQKFKGPAIYLNGADQGSWLNTGVGSDMAYPPAFAQITDGEFAGFWVPLYIPPRAII